MKVFISGIISLGGTLSEPEIRANIARFYEKERELRALGWDAVNSLEHHGVHDKASTSFELWTMYLRLDIKTLAECDAIYMMSGWEQSRGSRLELHIAKELGYTVLYEDELTKTD